jgi:hypothetical protein
MDWNYLYSLLSFFIGVAAGFQGIYERYYKDSLSASLTLPGLAYLLSRGAIPALLFGILYGYRFVERALPLQALACGTGAELVLRSRVYLRQAQKDDGVEELLRGPFDLLRWYQSLFLESIADSLARVRQRFVQAHLPEGDFENLCDAVSNNLDAWPEAAIRSDIETAVNRLKKDFEAEARAGSSALELDQKYRFKLGYLLLNKVGRSGFNTFLSR